MGTTVDELDQQLGDVDAANLRSRVTDAEGALEEVATQLEELTARLDELEPPVEE
jgi:hypothetical protein